MTDAVAATPAEDVASLGDQLAVGRHPWPVLRLRLDMEPEEFESVRSEFVQALAKALGVTAGEIAIVDIRRGCTNLAIQVPPAVANISEGVGPTLPPAVRQLADPFRLQRLEPDHGINSTFSLRVRSPKPRERVLSWLHLSDIHFPDDATSVLASPPELFLEDLPGCLDEEDLKPSFVLVSGDISYSAATQQFDYAREFLLSLEEVLPYPRRPLSNPG